VTSRRGLKLRTLSTLRAIGHMPSGMQRMSIHAYQTRRRTREGRARLYRPVDDDAKGRGIARGYSRAALGSRGHPCLCRCARPSGTHELRLLVVSAFHSGSGKRQGFCGEVCRIAFHRGCRVWAMRAVDEGRSPWPRSRRPLRQRIRCSQRRGGLKGASRVARTPSRLSRARAGANGRAQLREGRPCAKRGSDFVGTALRAEQHRRGHVSRHAAKGSSSRSDFRELRRKPQRPQRNRHSCDVQAAQDSRPLSR
jgi:hypothetical protein